MCVLYRRPGTVASVRRFSSALGAAMTRRISRITVVLVAVAVLGVPATAAAFDQFLGNFQQPSTKLQNITGVAASGSTIFVSDLTAGVMRFDYAGKPLATFAKGKITAPKG